MYKLKMILKFRKQYTPEAHPELNQTSKMEHFEKIIKD